jgi:ferrous iron transport protein A
MPLSDLPVGAAGRVVALKGDPNASARLREMGFCESAVVEKLSGTGDDTLRCILAGTRIALGDRAGSHIIVDMIRSPRKAHGR